MAEKNNFNFSWLINPTTPEHFFTNYWENETLIIRRNESKYWSPLLSIDSIDEIISSIKFNYPDIKLTNANKEIQKETYLSANEEINPLKIYKYFNEGHTIILNHLHKYVPSLSQLCRAMEKEFCMPFQTNIYLTPANSQGFKTHYDDHCVFILQISGVKRWRLYQKAVNLPTKDYFSENFVANPGFQQAEFDLFPGDVVYIPRGIAHDAVTSSTASLHITLGAMAYTWIDMFPEILKILTNSDVQFRKSIPTGKTGNNYSKDKMYQDYKNVIKKLESKDIFEEAFNKLLDQFISTRKPILHGQLAQKIKTGLSLSSLISQRLDLIYFVRETKLSIIVSCYDNKIIFPINHKNIIEYILKNEKFYINDIPGNYDFELKTVIVEKLINGGLLKIDIEEENHNFPIQQ